jgi:hypothetical protein
MPMYSACGNAALPALGFPIRESTDHRLFSAYPWLIAAVHALHRLLVPRHPPCALLILTVITHPANRTRGDTRYIGKTVQFSRTAQRGRPRDSRSVSQNSTACEPPILGTRRRSRPGARMRGCVQLRSTWLGPSSSTAGGMPARVRDRRSNPGDFPRKEVIQPHLPVRLPCYDFTPVTSPTFDGSLPEGLGHRLRVLLASVV